MRRASERARVLAVCCALAAVPLMTAELTGQGITTSAIRGTVRVADGSGSSRAGIAVDGARVSVLHTATGSVFVTESRDGRFLVEGLEVGGPYTVTVEVAGFAPQQRERVFITLGEPLELRFMLQPVLATLDTLRAAAQPFPHVTTHGGTATTISDSLLHRLPTLDRDLYDFVRLVPQISTTIGFPAGGMSGGGVGFRFNNFLINGVPERSLPGAQPPEFAGGKSISLDAISEYQVLVAPFDVRYGDFAGALVNAVTRSGTNELHGSIFAHARSEDLAAHTVAVPRLPYHRWQYGFSLGGPVRRDRMHFFIAPELQRMMSIAPGPYVGQPRTAPRAVPVSATDLSRFEQILRGYGLTAGSGAAVQNRNLQRNLFGRLDLALPEWNSRGVLSLNDTHVENQSFSREAIGTFPLSTNTATQRVGTHSIALQLHTALQRAGGGHNELLVSRRTLRGQTRGDVDQPLVRVVVPSTTGGAVTLVAGTPVQAQRGSVSTSNVIVRDNLTLPLGSSHVATVGAEVDRFRSGSGAPLNTYGAWSFANLDSLARGVADRFELARDFGTADVVVRGAYYAVYAGDEWRLRDPLSLTLGLRADLLRIENRPPHNPEVDSLFGRRTDQLFRAGVHLSPRFGFAWDVLDDGQHRIRGGVGVFTGRPPLAWLQAPLQSYGVGTGVLRCGTLRNDLGPTPPFEPDARNPPAACANGASITAAPRGPVDLLDPQLQLVRMLRATIAYDRWLPGRVLATVEALRTRSLADIVFVNLNLGEPVGIDRYGRVRYGSISGGGLSAPVLRSDFSEVIDLRNTSSNRSYQLSARLEKKFSSGTAATTSYTYSRARDVQTPLRVNVPGLTNWAGGRVMSGRHDDLTATTSLNDVPHRVVVAGTYRAPWSRWSTELSFYYVGESGSPFTFVAWGVSGRGDLNADGSNVNDPIYVPRDAGAASEIRFSGRSDAPGADNSPPAQSARELAQQIAFDAFIESTPCLRRNRGQILERNSCREPWSNTTVATVRQSIPLARRVIVAQLDMFNLLDLVHREWGLRRVASPAVLEHVGQTPGDIEESQPVFRFDAGAPKWTTVAAESSFQLQLGLRYRF